MTLTLGQELLSGQDAGDEIGSEVHDSIARPRAAGSPKGYPHLIGCPLLQNTCFGHVAALGLIYNRQLEPMIPTLSALVVVLACAFSWVGLDLLRKLLAGRGRATPITFALVAAQLPLFLGWAVIRGEWHIGASYWWPGLGSLVVNLLANLAYMQSVRLSPMSATLPLLSLTPVFTTLLGIPLLAEWPRVIQAVGILLVVAGAFLLNRNQESPTAGSERRRFWRSIPTDRGAILMISVALLWSLATPFDKLAIRHADPALHALILVAGITLGLFAVLLRQGRLGEIRDLRSSIGLVLLAAVCSGVAIFLQLLAIQMIWVGLVETVKRAVGAAMALALGRWVFREQVIRRQVAAVGLMLVGVWWVLI
ncbi:MAG: DMT family transporter [bacterium]|nr:DMT family transporter [bacterium]